MERLRLAGRRPTSERPHSPRIGTAEIEAALFTNCFAAVALKLGRAVGAEHGGVGAGLCGGKDCRTNILGIGGCLL